MNHRPSRVIDVGAPRRLFRDGTRRAIVLRDRNRCYQPSCTTIEGLDADHVRTWAEGGLTVAAYGRLACDFHNRHRAKGPPPADP